MKTKKSIVHNRHKLIIEELKKNKTIKIDELVTLLSVSPITLRRDLQLLEDQGLVQRFHGGATLIEASINSDTNSTPIEETSSSSNELSIKESIAKYAASLVEDGDTIFINSSSTAILTLKYLKDKHVVVITNNGTSLQIPTDPSVELVLTGGEVNKRKKCMVGDYATTILSKITADKCLLGVSGISSSAGISTSILQETFINKMMIERCKNKIFVLGDGSKVGKTDNFLIGHLDRVSTLITDSSADPEHINQLKHQGINIITID